jgi:dTDP-4-dehydrorhamnose reductase
MTVNTQGITVLGGRGMLGTDLVNTCKQSGFVVNALDLPEFDITDYDQLKGVVENSKVIINCAAYTDVEKAEAERDSAYRINAEAVGQLGHLAKTYGAYVVHISTDFVFDGSKEIPYVETDSVNPINVYGQTKFKGEELLGKADCKSCIMRVQWTYGTGGSNFVTKLVDAAKVGKELRIVEDQIGSPTATSEVASVICRLLKFDLEPVGIFHFSASGFVSRYEMARFIFDKLGMDLAISKCKTSDYKSAARRPLNSRFDCSKIIGLLGEPIRPWQEPLEDFLENL